MDSNDVRAVQQPGIIPGPAPRPVGQPVDIPPTSSPSFRSVLENVAAAQQSSTATSSEPLKFSAHAMARLQSRNISLTSEDVTKMNAMADKAAAKGAKNSLFIVRDTAMIVSIKNRTVITAVDSDSMKDNVFTNIDSAAII
ncbi:MAG TPA: TIGR02530 family flagellar biosynthesis protein [Candidatus Acidoferrales bacterium]|nr:TIGR02530 family flagellar biosynthesis protein [Candidatus Acidoferrales bacterium]HTX57792.1 TIGR02530 family flagellar biosynthesis protein [Candidatus Acidoferrales bacterium]